MYFVNVTCLQTLQCSKLLEIWYVQNVIRTSKLIFLSLYQTTPGMGLSMDRLISNICTFMYGNTVCDSFALDIEELLALCQLFFL